MMGSRLSTAAAPWLMALALGCSKPDQAAACNQDHQTLRALMSEDQRVGRLLHEADALAATGQGATAAAHVERAARPESEKVVTHVEAFQPASRWGATRREELHDVVRERRRAMDAYAQALRSDDLAAIVREMESQRALEVRALALQQRLSAPPDAATGACAPP